MKLFCIALCKNLKCILMGVFIVVISGLLIAYGYYRGIFGSHISLTKTTFDRLPQWSEDDPREALLAFQRSCREILKRSPSLLFSPLPYSGDNAHWQTICRAAVPLSRPSQTAARQFFMKWFEPYAVKNNFNPTGLFTGYYLPRLQGNLKKTARYSVPLYSVPKDLVKVNLALLDPMLPPKTLTGQVKNNALFPYPDRAAIQNGALVGAANALAWSDSLVDVFFAQIQGSVIIDLSKRRSLLLGFAGSNGRPYTAIGKILIERGEIPREKMSMQAIRAWLAAHPAEAAGLLNQNASYVFFKILGTSAPLGAEQVPLTPQRSLAVDLGYLGVGTPVWLSTRAAQQKTGEEALPWQRLMIAQDTGGAIKGPMRGDIYWGSGPAAAFAAGQMKSEGRYWVLLPRFCTPKGRRNWLRGDVGRPAPPGQ
jgi:membrane-bound lytic murein transglycosylase A